MNVDRNNEMFEIRICHLYIAVTDRTKQKCEKLNEIVLYGGKLRKENE